MDATISATAPAAARHYGDLTAVICGAATVTFADLDRLASRIATRLAPNGVQPGDRVAVLLVGLDRLRIFAARQSAP